MEPHATRAAAAAARRPRWRPGRRSLSSRPPRSTPGSPAGWPSAGLTGFLRGRLATAGLVSAGLAAAACQHAAQVSDGESPRWSRLLTEAAARTPSPAQRARRARRAGRCCARPAPPGLADYCPQPMVAAAGCEHHAAATVELEPGGVLRWREAIVLGRHGEPAGHCVSRLDVSIAGAALYRGELAVASPDTDRSSALGPYSRIHDQQDTRPGSSRDHSRRAGRGGISAVRGRGIGGVRDQRDQRDAPLRSRGDRDHGEQELQRDHRAPR